MESKEVKMHYYLIGIGGISMSGLAKLLKAQGHQVSGSDIKNSQIIDRLKKDNIKVYIGHSNQNITKDIDQIIYTAAAATPKAPAYIEIEQAKRLNISLKTRSAAIGELMKGKIGITVSGTHGKTTTTAMIGQILADAGLDPTVLLGGEYSGFGGNVRVGKSVYFIAEACEYARQFLDFRPKIAILTNIEKEHLDYYKGGLSEILEAFKEFVQNIPRDGNIIAFGDDENIRKIIQAAGCPTVTYGKSNFCDFKIIKNKVGQGKQIFQIKNTKTGETSLPYQIKIPGIFNVLNSTAAAILAKKLKIQEAKIQKSLVKFFGVARRFEFKGVKKGVTVFDDYAHHPTEIKVTLKAARDFFPNQKIWVIFQPHQYSRTKLLLSDFGKAFKNADKIIVPEIFEVTGREEKKDISSKDLVNEIKKNGGDAIFFSDFESIFHWINRNLQSNTILLTMGAGEAYKIGEKYLKNE